MDAPIVLALSRLRDAKPTAGGWIGRCPAHEDHTPSLSLAEGSDGRVLLHCHAGCANEEVLRGLNLTVADLFGDRSDSNSTSMVEVASYKYSDEHDVHLFDVVRFAPKDFRQRSANGKWSVKGVRRVLYRLSAVIEAVKMGKTVYVVEGEKDVEALEALDLTATTNPGGAGKWQIEYDEYFRGATVVILPDNDDTGRDHAQDTARHLVALAKAVRIVELPNIPEKGDVSDWLAAGGTVEELAAIIAMVPTVVCPIAAGTDEHRERKWEQAPGFRAVISLTPEDLDDDDDELGRAWEMRARPELSSDALAGPIGEAVSLCAPECEAAPISIMLPALAIFGGMVGRRAVQDIGGTQHFHNIYGMLVGVTGAGRKGTGNGVAHRLMHLVDSRFMAENVAGGLSSGEGLIARVADPKEPTGESFSTRDCRLHLAEEEAGIAFARMKKEGNSLSGVLRQGWDGRTLSTLTRKDDGGMVAKQAHITVIMQVTPDELRRGLADIELVNGFMNRFILAFTEQVRSLPFGRPFNPDILVRPTAQLQAALRKLPTVGTVELKWTKEAYELYASTIYPSLTPLQGRLAAMTARGAPIIRRLTGIYCLSRGDSTIAVEDLNAAVAIWNYSLASARYIYGGVVFSVLAQRMFKALEREGLSGLTLSSLRREVGGNKVKKGEWDAALQELQLSRQVVADQEKTGGRSRTTLRLALTGKMVKKAASMVGGDLMPLISPVGARTGDAPRPLAS